MTVEVGDQSSEGTIMKLSTDWLDVELLVPRAVAHGCLVRETGE